MSVAFSELENQIFLVDFVVTAVNSFFVLSLLICFLKKGTDSSVYRIQAGTTCVDPGLDMGSWTHLINQKKSIFANSLVSVKKMALNEVLQRVVLSADG